MKFGALAIAALAGFSFDGSRVTPEEIRFVATDGLALVKTFEVEREMESETTAEDGSRPSSSSAKRRLVVTDRSSRSGAPTWSRHLL